MAALNDVAVRNAKPEAKPKKCSDGRGLFLLITPAGGKLWRLAYRFEGKQKQLALGAYPDVSLKDARERRDAARKLLTNGVDPSENRKAVRAAKAAQAENSFEIVAREWYDQQKENWNESHSVRILRRLERNVFPWIGGKPIAEVTAPDLLSMARRIEKRGAIETAHRALQNCGQVFRYAIATGRAERNPVPDLQGALPPAKPTHMAAITEPAKVGDLLRAFDAYEGTLIVRNALQLAPLVFVRPGELRKAEWNDIDLDAAEWRFTVSKTKTPHIVPLSRQAVAILREIQPLTDRSRYVFPSARTRERPMSDNALLAAMRRMGIAKDEMTGHGFRAMARTILDEVMGFRPDFIEHQLAHAVRDPNGRAYNRTAHLPERRKMMQAWADYLDKLKQGADVIQLRTQSEAD
jgi:integrase